jgi:formylglycine-generating enzyme required for sulfatase activity
MKQTGYKYRLLSESEWEYAARAGTEGKFYFGDTFRDMCKYANIPDNSMLLLNKKFGVIPCADGYQGPAPVGKFKPNAFALYDMIGNVWEWVEDCWHESFVGAPNDNSPWLQDSDCNKRVIRGAAYDDLSLIHGVADRRQWSAGAQHCAIGFRVAREIDR